MDASVGMDELLLAEDLLLLLLDDEKGTLSAASSVRLLLGGAMLADLDHRGLLELTKGSFLKRSSVRACACAGPLDPVLRRALDLVAAKQRSPQALVGQLGKGAADELTARLADRGLLRRHEGRVLGLFPRTTWPARDLVHENRVRLELAHVLVDGAEPTPRVRTLIALLAAIGRVSKVVAGDRRQITARAKELSQGEWAAKAVKSAIDSTNSAAGAVAVSAAVSAS